MSILINAIIDLFFLIIRLMIYISKVLWDIVLRLIPPLAAKYGEVHEENKRKMLIESVPSEKWNNCFDRLIEYRKLCFDNNDSDNQNSSVKYQMEQSIKDEFGINISKYMKDNDAKKLDLLIYDLQQYIAGEIQPSKKNLKFNTKS